MPTNVAGLITPTYDAVVNVAADTEVLTEASLTDSVVALGNRIAFVRESSPELAQKPDGIFTFRDDFTSCKYNNSETRFYSAVPWIVNSSLGSPALSGDVGQSKNPGTLFFFQAGGVAGETIMYLDAQLSFATLEYMLVVLKATHGAGNSDEALSFGFGDNTSSLGTFNPDVGGANSLMCYYWRTQSSTQWRQVRTVASSTFTGNTLGTYTSGEYVRIEMIKQPNGDLGYYFNGSLATTTSVAQTPSGDCRFMIKGKLPATDASDFLSEIDFVQIRTRIPDRSGA